MSSLVSFQDVSCELNTTPILHHVSLDVQAGETLVLLGRSGSGKTTLLKMVNGLILPSSGTVFVEQTPTSQWDLTALRRRIGYVIQEGGLFPHWTVEQNVSLVPQLQGWESDRIHQHVSHLLNQIGLPLQKFGSRYPRELSGGQRQRVGVARALAADPDILLFDEPFGALDPITRVELQQQFLQLRNEYGKTAIFVTHDIREALMLGTRIGLLDHGRVSLLATPDEFQRAQGDEVQAFLSCLDPRGSS